MGVERRKKGQSSSMSDRRDCREPEYHGSIRRSGSKTEKSPQFGGCLSVFRITRTGGSGAYVIDEWERTDG